MGRLVQHRRLFQVLLIEPSAENQVAVRRFGLRARARASKVSAAAWGTGAFAPICSPTGSLIATTAFRRVF
ncbi:MAG: hypothetical protein ACREQC_14150 [Candidatus Binataceae bacterium]